MQNICMGDQPSFNELYRRYKDRLFYYFYRMLGSCEELSNDFLQDLFFKIIDKPEMYNPSYPFKKWIFSVAHNMCKNEYRKREVRKVMLQEENPDRYIDEHIVPKDSAKVISLAFEAIDQLKPKSKEILLLKYRENFSLKEIAEILELNEGTIKSRLHYARVELSKALSKHKIKNKFA